MYFQSEAAALLAEMRTFAPPYFLFLEGPLGAGKTTFMQALVAAMGADATQVQSPTFLKLIEYQVGGFGRVAHMDCYRVGSPDELANLQLEAYAERLVRLWAVEWPGPLQQYLQANPLVARAIGYSRPWRLLFSVNGATRSVRWTR